MFLGRPCTLALPWSRDGFWKWRGMRVLVVEDNEELAQLLANGLQAAGYDVDRLASVNDAQVALRTTRYATLILDLGLPDGDGLALLRELRGRKDPIPVLILTARGGVHDRVS